MSATRSSSSGGGRGSASLSDAPVSQQTIARLTGLSQKTVSRVVNGFPGVSDATRELVTAAIADLGYRPNTAARALASRRSTMIGIVTFGETSYGTYANIVGIARAARDLGYSTMISTSLDITEGPQQAVEELLERGVDGIIVSEPVDDSTWDPSILRDTPLISIGSDSGPRDRIMVGYDQAAAAELATGHLLELGHETVWHVSGSGRSRIAADRARGWRRALERAGRTAPPSLGAEDWSARAGYEAGRRIAAMRDATAVFAANDRIAIGVMRAVVESGRRIPEDFSVVGFDDVPDAEYQIVPLTTIHEDPSVLALRAVEELVALMSGAPRVPQKIELPLELAVRGSSGPAPIRARASGGETG